MELSTLNKIIRNQDTFFVVIMNNPLKIISVATWCMLPSKVWEEFFQKKFSCERTKHFCAKKVWGGCSKYGGLMIRSCQGLAGFL